MYPYSVDAPFGQITTAMITPFTADDDVDLDGVQRLALHLVEKGCTGLIVNGTTGEAPTTTDAEKDTILRAVCEAVRDRAVITAGVGTNDTAHSVALARAAERAGAHGALVTTPYYSKPPQEGVYRHCMQIAEATSLPIMLYDIPGRTGIPFEVDTLVRLAEHPRIAAVKDAKGDLSAASWTMARTNLSWYSGDDMNNLPLFSLGAAGCVSVVGHLVADRLRNLYEAYAAGEVQQASKIHRELLPIYTGFFRTQGVITVKAALRLQGLPAGPVRPPLIDATAEQIQTLRRDCEDGALTLTP